MSSTHTAKLNQVDVMQVKAFIDRVGATPELADRDPHVTARWVGGSRAKITFGAISMHLGVDGDLNPMQALLGSLAACDVDLVAMHASLLGIEITELWVEAGGHFQVARYLGLDSEQPPRIPAYRLHGSPSHSRGIRGADRELAGYLRNRLTRR